MPSTFRTLRACAAGLAAAVSALAHAGVVESADVGGFRTFQDTLTGNVWVDLDARFGSGPTPTLSYGNYSTYLAALQAEGFTWASSAQVLNLLDTLTFSSNPAVAAAQAQAYAAVMSSRWFNTFELVRGIAENTGTPTGQRQHGLVFSSLPFWGTFASSVDFNAPSSSTVGLWAFKPAGVAPPAPVPEPGTWALAGLALALLAAQRRRKPGAPAARD